MENSIIESEILLAVLIFINVILLTVVLIIGGFIMDTIKSNIDALNAAITALQGRLASGVIVQQSDIDSINASLTQATTTLGTIAA